MGFLIIEFGFGSNAPSRFLRLRVAASVKQGRDPPKGELIQTVLAESGIGQSINPPLGGKGGKKQKRLPTSLRILDQFIRRL